MLSTGVSAVEAFMRPGFARKQLDNDPGSSS
jgi:hypothetical protein